VTGAADPELRVKALEQVLVEKGYVDPATVDVIAETYEHNVGPHNGATEGPGTLGTVPAGSASPAMARAVLDAVISIDCRPILSSITVPTLVVHRTGDRACSVEAGRYLAEHIPGAVMVEQPGDDHTIVLGPDRGAAVFDAIEEFLTGVRRAPDQERILATVLLPMSWTRRVMPPGWETRPGASCWTSITPRCGMSSNASAAGR
jgi:pimeloyl-ACP methyl ester carboxylesterase